MTHRSNASRRSKRVALAFVASALLTFGSPFVASSSADAGNAAHKSVSADFGDCKNDNAGLHYGFDCPGTSGGGGVTTTIGST
jgi:hypothetical protein